MPPGDRLLLCGSGGRLGSLLAAAVASEGGDVVGVGPRRPRADWPEAVGWTRLNASGKGLAEVLAEQRPDVVVLFPWDSRRRRFAARRRAVEAASRAVGAVLRAGVPRLLLWSSTRALEPAPPGQGPIPETAQPAPGTTAVGRESAAVEVAVRERLDGSDGPALLVLRAAQVVGRTAGAELERLPDLALLPRVRGVDPPLQFLHEEDAVEVLRRGVRDLRPGTYHLAADGVVAWSEICRAVQRPGIRLPGWLWRAMLTAAWAVRLSPVPATVVDLACRSWVVDNARLKTHVGYRPRHTGREALAAWLAARERAVAQK